MDSAGNEKTYLLIIKKFMDYLHENGFKPGDKLPPEEAIAAKLYFGRPALREALRILELMGVIESSRGKSNVYVGNMPMGLQGFFSVFLSVYDDAFEGISLLRANIEVIGVEAFIKNATEMDIRELEFIAYKFLEEKDDAFISCTDDKNHIEFHKTLLKYSASEFEKEFVAMCVCMQVLSPVIGEIKQADPDVAKKIRSKRSHFDLIEAIRNKDVDLAKTIARNHCAYYSDLKQLIS